MRKVSTITIALVGALSAGCAGVTVQPGHRALMFDPTSGGIQHEVLQPGWYRTACGMFTPENKCPRVDDFDVTYSTSKEEVHGLSAEQLPLDLTVAVVYRPIVSELYLLDTEIGPNYFEEVVRPEFRSAALGVLAHTSYLDLQRKNGSIEDEVEKALRDRLRGKHIEISSVLIEKANYAPEILQAERERVVSQQTTLRNKQLMENEATEKQHKLELSAATKKLELETASQQKKMELAAQTEQKKLELEAEAEQTKLSATSKLEVQKIQIQKETEEEKYRIDSELRNKQAERKLVAEQGQIDKMRADAEAAAHVSHARGEAQARLALAKATEAETRASVANVTPMHVMMHAYDALGQMGGKGTTLVLGDWSKTPQFLFPRIPAFQSMFTPWGGGGVPGVMTPMNPAPSPSASAPSSGDAKLSQK
jgi:regulator of protease activity HflC (stomatin/prohibitin superfamily)